MKISHTMRDLFGFAIVAVLGSIGFPLLRVIASDSTGMAYMLLFMPMLTALSLVAVGVLGMIWVIVERLVAAVVARRRAKTSQQKDLCKRRSA